MFIALILVLLTFLFLLCKMIRMGNTEKEIYDMAKDTIEKNETLRWY